MVDMDIISCDRVAVNMATYCLVTMELIKAAIFYSIAVHAVLGTYAGGVAVHMQAMENH